MISLISPLVIIVLSISVIRVGAVGDLEHHDKTREEQSLAKERKLRDCVQVNPNPPPK
jgi:hypothetical protein